MRLTDREVTAMLRAVEEIFGSDAEVILFGSRVDDRASGGDIDLMICLNAPVEHPAWDIARCQAKIIMELGDQKIDILLDAPNLPKYQIHQTAREKGIPLNGSSRFLG